MVMDTFSLLPSEILDLILSFLPTKEAARTIVLSKQWLKAWSTIPHLDFQPYFFNGDQSFLDGDQSACRSQDKFLKYVNGTIERYREQGLPINKLSLRVAINDEKVASLVDQWIRTALQCGAKEVCLDFESLPTASSSLFQTVFSTKEVVALRLCQRDLKLDCLDGMISPRVLNYPYLKELTFSGLFLSEGVFQKLISSCPLIETLTLLGCKGLKEMQVANLPKLKYFHAQTLKNQTVVINVPSLEVLMYSCSRRQYTCLLDVEGTHNVKELGLSSASITDERFHKIVSKFPLLEDLWVGECSMVRRINVSSSSLRTLSLTSCPELVEATIDAPNLKRFHYEGNSMPSFSFTSNPVNRESSAYLNCLDRLDNSWFQKLNQFLKIFRPSDQIMLFIKSQEVSFSITKDLRESKPLKLENLDLSVYSPRSQFATIMEGLLWSCSPKTLLLEWGSVGAEDFIEYLCKELIESRHGQSNSSSDEAKSWWRDYFQQVKIEILDDTDTEGEWRPLGHWKSWAEVMQALGHQSIMSFSRDY